MCPALHTLFHNFQFCIKMNCHVCPIAGLKFKLAQAVMPLMCIQKEPEFHLNWDTDLDTEVSMVFLPSARQMPT
jgi:hypothetical protein